MSIKYTRRGAAKAGLFAVLLLLVVGGSLAYRFLFNRPGEMAIQLIPADAFVVVTLDTNPSPSQTPIFSRIKKALEANGLTQKFESSVSDLVQKSPVVAQVRPYTSTSFALAILAPQGGKTGFDGEPVVLISAKEPAKVEETLSVHGAKENANGLTVYKFASDKTYAAVIGSYLVISPKAADIARIDDVRKGSTKSVSSLIEYQQARAALPEDSNLMVFLSPGAMKEMNQIAGQAGKKNPWTSAQWMAFSVTLRDAGIAFDYRMPMDQSRDVSLKALAGIQPLDFEMMKKLPSGAYGVIATSQPSEYWSSIDEAVRNQGADAKGFDDGIAEFEKHTGISIQKDILPGLKGHLWLAAYPDTRGSDRGVDGLVVIDDANGADPAALAEKVRLFAEKSSADKGKTGISFNSEEKDGATVWTLDPKSTEDLRNGVAEATASGPAVLGASPAGRPDISISPDRGELDTSDTNIQIHAGKDEIHVTAPGSKITIEGDKVDVKAPGAHIEVDGQGVRANGSGVRVNGEAVASGSGSFNTYEATQKPQTSPEAKKFAENKTVVHAQIGRAVLIATSQQMLDRAVAAYNGQGASLAEDTSYTNMRAALPPGSQSVMLVNVGAIMQALRPVIEKAMKDTDATFTGDDLINLFGQSAGLVAGGKYDGTTAVGTLFLPIDYERAIKGLGALMKSFDPAPPSKITWIRQVPSAIAALHGKPRMARLTAAYPSRNSFATAVAL